ncbi:B3 domain-containing protein At3g17010 [Eutrema salsugineum]|uniref:B3 domain-containing protein At3g17010 n=1 Tax=Eutrema salsugineum TaxID=72664 RepID=UPI000CECE617|nr:B3 domain-containing protein At3g17010 [Eutrema salsugineum]
MARNSGFCRIKNERKKLSFFKIFQSADLSSECMRAIPYNFMQRVSEKDFSYKMVIRAQWGSSWKVEISKNPRFYYMEKHGWNQFVSDNALGDNEFVTFTHKGKMWFDVNIYHQNGKEILIPRNTPTMAPSGIKKEQGESSYKDVKKEDETGDSTGGEDLEVRKKKAKESKTSKKKKLTSKKVVSSVEIGESSRGVELKVRKTNAEKPKSSKKNKIRSKKDKNGVPKFKITIRKSYLKFLAIPKRFVEGHIPNKSTIFTIHHWKGNCSWEVLCLVRENRTIFSSGWTKLAREYPLLIGDRCIFKLIKPTELLLISKKAREKIIKIDE